MSDEDAAQLSRFYRARAIEIIKVLDGKTASTVASPRGDADGLTAAERIDRDVAARLESSASAEESEDGDSKDSAGEGA